MLRLLKASLFGALAAAAAPSLITGIFALSFLMDGDFDRAVYALLLPLFIAAPLVFVSAVALGLPAHILAQITGKQSLQAYTTAGCVLGGVIILVPILIATGSLEGAWICALGALCGGVTARTWWHDMPNHQVR